MYFILILLKCVIKNSRRWSDGNIHPHFRLEQTPLLDHKSILHISCTPQIFYNIEVLVITLSETGLVMIGYVSSVPPPACRHGTSHRSRHTWQWGWHPGKQEIRALGSLGSTPQQSWGRCREQSVRKACHLRLSTSSSSVGALLSKQWRPRDQISQIRGSEAELKIEARVWDRRC